MTNRKSRARALMLEMAGPDQFVGGVLAVGEGGLRDSEQTDRITVSEADYVRLMDAIANPPEPTEALKRLMRGRKESP